MMDTVKLGDVLLCEPGDALVLDEATSARLVQDAPAVRAVNMRVFDRGNRRLSVSFTRTRRAHASSTAARVFVADHEEELATITGAQPCEFRFEGPGGTVTRFLRSAVLVAHRVQWRGATTIHTYILAASSWSTSAA